MKKKLLIIVLSTMISFSLFSENERTPIGLDLRMSTSFVEFEK